MRDQLVLLFVGFVLTSIVGGLLGSFLQNRSWRHQHEAHLRETERQAALGLFEEISTLMDRRLYRMWQLHWKLERRDSVGDDAVEAQMERYRDVLSNWNDGLNRNLALAETYFGRAVRDELDFDLYERFKALGARLEHVYAGNRSAGGDVARELRTLSDAIYALNVAIVRQIQSGDVGAFLAVRGGMVNARGRGTQ